ncbi:MAG TPA: ferrous iron transport protein B, partial [Firmicutes bacterium]|nr:ferrous iron transport protein B [Bacillota bacterium]
VLVLVYGLIGAVLNRLLPGKSTDLIIDLPPLRLPRFSNVMKKTGARLSGFLLEATPIFAIGALAVSIMLETGILQWIQQLLAPITTVWLRLPAEASRAFVMGLMRRDFGAAGLYELAMTPQQTLVAVVTITLFVPCIASMLVFLKERGLREGLSIFFGSIVFSILTGGILTRVLALLPSFI